MEETKSFRYTPSIVALFIWVTIIGLILFISIGGGKPYQVEAELFEKPVCLAEELNFTDYASKSIQDRDIWSILIVSIGFIGVCVIFKPKKIDLNTEGIKVYRWFMKKPYYQKKWSDFSTIHIGVGEGIYGILDRFGLMISYVNSYGAVESEFISLAGFKESKEIQQLVSKFAMNGPIVSHDEFEVEDISIKEMLIEGFKLFKSNRKAYYVYSCIILIFTVLQEYFKNTDVMILSIIIGIFFSVRALIAMWHHMYSDCNGIKTNFDKSWDYGQKQVGRMTFAYAIVELFMVVFIIVSVNLMIIDLSAFMRLLVLCALGIVIFLLHARLYFLPYIASITAPESSYTKVDSQFNKNFFKHKLLLSSVNAIRLILFGTLVWCYKDNLEFLMSFSGHAVYVSSAINFFMTPLFGCFSMYCLKTLSLKKE